MKFQERIKAIFKSLNLNAKAKDNKLDEEDWKAINAAYKSTYGGDLATDQAEFERLQAQNIERSNVINILNTIPGIADDNDSSTENQQSAETTTQQTAGAVTTPPADQQTPAGNSKDVDLTAMVTRLATLVTLQTSQINSMSQRAAADVPAGVVQLSINACGPGTTATHLFGINHPMFSMDSRWNKIAANSAFAALSSPTPEDETRFHTASQGFAASLQNRFSQLHNEGRLNVKTLNEAFTFATSDLADANLGSQFVTRRQDALIARILMLNSVAPLFNTRFGVQDRELITNAFFTEVTQGFQTGAIFKGGMSLQPEYGHVDDLMIKVQFGSMKEIERMYIGYLNTSGSDPIKWNMIEFALYGLYKQAMNEYNKRKIMGIGVKPEAGKPAYFLTGSTGVLYTIFRYMHELKVLSHSDKAYATYSNSTMLAVIKAFIADVRESLPIDLDLNGFAINLNANHKQWWKACIRTAYGKETDFLGVDSYANNVPDEDIPIRWIPNMGKSAFMWLEQPGNIQFLENLPGEPLAIKMKEDMEEVKAWSTFKEGTTAAFVGKKFDTPDELVTNAYNLQQIFCNKPSAALVKNVTEFDGKDSFWFETIANDAPTAITDITNPVKGVGYIIECQGLANATTIAKAGKFAGIKSAYTPIALGDYLMVILNTDGNGFLELERTVNGVRTVNSDVQPNVPGAR